MRHASWRWRRKGETTPAVVETGAATRGDPEESVAETESPRDEE